MGKLSRRMKRLLAIVLVEAIIAANVITSYANESYEPFTMTEEEAASESGEVSYEEESYEEPSYEENSHVEESEEISQGESEDEEESQKKESGEEAFEEASDVQNIPAMIPEEIVSDEEENVSDEKEASEEELICICTKECTIEEYNKECPVCKEIGDLTSDEEKEEFLLKKCLIVKENADKIPSQTPTPSPQSEKPTATPSASPEATQTPLVTATPDIDKLATASPKASETPEVTATPAVSATPEASETPDVSASPEATAEADASTSPEAAAEADASTSPDAIAVVSASPAISASPEGSASPDMSASPSAAPGLTGVVIEKEEGLDGSVEQRASRWLFSKQVNMDYTVTVKNTSEETITNVEVTAVIPSIITIGSVSDGSISDGTITWTVDEITAGKTVKLTAKGYINENTDNVDNLNGRFYINGEKIEDVSFDGEWRLLEADDTEGPTYISTVVDGMTISVSAADGSVLPSGVSVKATKVSASDAMAALASELGLNILDAVAYDVVLIVNGEEVQPDGSVVVSFHDIPIEYEEGGEVGVAHMADSDTIEDISEGGSLQDVSIETTHFSVYVVYSTKISGTYSPSNGVTTGNGESMACFDFHIFANYYDAEYNGHVNGNFAIKNIQGEIVSTFGFNNGDKIDSNKKVFYVEHLTAWNPDISNNYHDSIFIFGPDITVDVVYDEKEATELAYAVENGVRILLGYYRNLKDRLFTSETNYIDFAEEFRKAEAYSKELKARQGTSGAQVVESNNGADKSISGSGDEIVINMTGEDLAKSNGGQIKFNAQKAGQKFIINVVLKEDSYDFTSNGMFYVLNDNSLTNSEANAFSSGSIIWNFVDSNGNPYTGTIIIRYNWLGTVLAPKATVKFGVVNGSVVADKVHKLEGESHKGDYSSNKISFTVTKIWGEDGQETHPDIVVSLYRRVRLKDGSFADGGVLDRTNLDDPNIYEFIETKKIFCSTGETSITFEGLPSCDEYGYTCDYFVVEKEGPDGYKVSYEGNNVIVNEPTTPGPTRARLELTAQKTLDGRSLKDGEFTFLLTGEGESKEAKNDATGKISFGEFVYNEAKTYEYTITEVVPDPADTNMTYDRSVYKVIVKVVADEAGNLKIESITYTRDGASADGVVFTNTYDYHAEGKAEIEAFKTLNEKAPGENVFTFILEDENHNEITTAVNDGYGNITFKDIDALHYTQEDIGKTFTYYVREKNDGKAGYVYSTAVYEVKVTVTDKGDGTLNVAVVYEKGLKPAFDNQYNAKGDLQLNAVKVLKNGVLTDGAFNFKLTETDAKGKVTVYDITNAADGTLNLPKFEYTLEDVARSPITYELREMAGSDSNILYDDAIYKVVVTLTDDGQGGIKVVADGKVDSFTFTNTSIKDVEAKIQAHKTLNDGDPGDKTFWFVLTDESGKETKVQNKGGNIDFGTFKYTAADLGKTYTYKIKEVIEDKAGYQYDREEYTVTVTITDEDQDGQLEAKVLYDDGKTAPTETAPTFRNTYTAKGGVTVRAKKHLHGEKELKAGDFTFELWNVTDGHPGTKVEEVTNEADGTITFKKINYELSDAGKTFIYEVREAQGTENNGYTYDATVYTVEVTVTDNGTGELTVTPVYKVNGREIDGEASFNNYYKAEGSTRLQARKTLSGRAIKDGQFSFELKDESGKILQTKDNIGELIIFDEIKYDKKGIYKYTINEVIGNEAGYTYDRTVYNVTVTVTDNGDGTLNVHEEYTNVGEEGIPVFKNSYNATGSATLGATKTVSGGRALTNGQFSFELWKVVDGDNRELIETVSNDGTGRIQFKSINFTADDIDKTYTYIIKEVLTDPLPGYTYDSQECIVTVKISDNGDGTLKVETEYSKNGNTGATSGTAEFINYYSTTDKSVQLTATKGLTGKDLADNQFSFELWEVVEGGNNKLLQTKFNSASGAIIFDVITYTLSDVGEHRYIIKESPVTAPGYEDYDTTEYEAVVTVTDNGDGTLSVSVEYPKGIPTFNNFYKTNDTSVTLEAAKQLVGRDLVDGQFTFELWDESGNVITSTTNDADGKIVFKDIPALQYTQADIGSEKKYTIHEVNNGEAGYTYAADIEVTVTIIDNGDGTLSAVPVYINANGGLVESATFTNYYTADGEAVIKAKKTLEGSILQDEQFTFILEDKDGKEIEQVTNVGDAVSFTPIHYSLEDAGKTFTYYVREKVETRAGYYFDNTRYTVTVEVTDNGTGELSTVVKYNGSEEVPVFKNSYDANGELKLTANKTLTGRELTAGQFSFELVDEAGNVLQTVTNAADGSITFEPIKYTVKDVANSPITYTVRELAGTEEGITYDSTVYTVKVTLTDNGDGTIEVNSEYVGVERINFTNTYAAEGEAVLRAQKTLEGGTLTDRQFSFELRDEEGNVLQTKQNDAGGAVVFDPISYTGADDGRSFHYTIREVLETIEGYVFDETVHNVTVTVTDDGTGRLEVVVTYDSGMANFVNRYTPESTPTPTPDTPGDEPETTPTPETPGGEPGTPETPETITITTPAPTGQVLGARRTRIGGTDAAVLGARRGSDYAVLGKRRRPSTGDSIAMVLWLLTMMAGVGGAIVSLIMLHHNRKKGE